jgi:hypothetical protein
VEIFFMIAFDLVCSNGHKFECWFKTGKSLEEQISLGLVSCPVCQDTHVERAFSTFGIKKHQLRQATEESGKIDPMAALQAVYEYIDKNFEDVGLNFTREALKMHFGESKKRNIKGMTLPTEEEILKDEGVPFVKIPIVKRLDN